MSVGVVHGVTQDHTAVVMGSAFTMGAALRAKVCGSLWQ